MYMQLIECLADRVDLVLFQVSFTQCQYRLVEAKHRDSGLKQKQDTCTDLLCILTQTQLFYNW